MTSELRRIASILGLLLLMTLIGTFGFRMLSGSSWINCAYMAVITLTTVGFEEVVPLTEAGRLFVIVYLICGLGTFTYSAFQLGELIVSTRVQSLLEKNRMDKRIRTLEGHFIVCGCGRTGETICEYLANREKPFVVIDTDEDRLKEVCEERNWPFVVGDATLDSVLVTAGIGRAGSLAAALPTDADNVYVSLSARLLNADLQIVARAEQESAVEKIERAGASRVISPVSSGAIKMARFMLSPSVEDFLEITDGGGALELADIQVGEDSPLAGKRLSETGLGDRGVMVIGIRRANGERLMPPSGSARVEIGDSLFAFGSSTAVSSMITEA